MVISGTFKHTYQAVEIMKLASSLDPNRCRDQVEGVAISIDVMEAVERIPEENLEPMPAHWWCEL